MFYTVIINDYVIYIYNIDFQNKFEFKCINKKYPEHIYSFVLRISEEGEYSGNKMNG